MPGVGWLRSTSKRKSVWKAAGLRLRQALGAPRSLLQSQLGSLGSVWSGKGGEPSPRVMGTGVGVRFLKASLRGPGKDTAVSDSWVTVGGPGANIFFFVCKQEKTFLGLTQEKVLTTYEHPQLTCLAQPCLCLLCTWHLCAQTQDSGRPVFNSQPL